MITEEEYKPTGLEGKDFQDLIEVRKKIMENINLKRITEDPDANKALFQQRKYLELKRMFLAETESLAAKRNLQEFLSID